MSALRGKCMRKPNIRRVIWESLALPFAAGTLILALGLEGCTAHPGDAVSIIAGGDCLLDRYDVSPASGVEAARRWSTLIDAANASSAFLFNLETTVGSGGAAKKKRFVFRAPAEALFPLSGFACPVAALANNHAMDYGPRGLSATIGALDGLGIAHAGAGRTAVEAAAATKLALRGETISVFSFGFDEDRSSYNEGQGECIAPLEPIVMKRMIAASVSPSMAIVVMLHWGIEYDRRFNGYQQELARELVRAGADLVVGTGPHVLQGVEVYRGSLICYSIGNLVFDDLGSDDTTATVIVRMSLAPGAVRKMRKHFEIAPLRTRNATDGPSRPTASDADHIVALLSERSPEPGIFAKRPRLDTSGIEWFSLE